MKTTGGEIAAASALAPKVGPLGMVSYQIVPLSEELIIALVTEEDR